MHSEQEGTQQDSAALLLARVRERIVAAARRVGRAPEDVTLIGASKTVPTERVARMAAAGLRDFGENHAVDLASKKIALDRADLRWHFLGKLQRGTAKHVAHSSDVVHSGEPGKSVERLARVLGELDRRIDILAQVDFAGDRQGAQPDELLRFIDLLHSFPSLRPVGLMTIPPLTATPDEARPFFARLRTLRDELTGRWPGLVELSMGMSADYEVAVEEGATMVRVGTALFGRRP